MNRAIAFVAVTLTVVGVSSAAGAGSAAAPATAICPSFRTNGKCPLRLCD